MKIKTQMAKFFNHVRNLNKKEVYTPTYRVVEIFQDEEGDYMVQIQIINKSLAFKSKPEDILAKDNLVDQFSPRDVRTLTYLGYLGVNAPKYKILAKRLCENDKLMFAIKKKGDDKVIIKTADQIMQEKEILESLNSQDAHDIGYTFASENVVDERNRKKTLK